MYENENTVSDSNKLFIIDLDGKLLRNNSGVAFDKKGRPTRFGLGNVSKKVNEVFKSSDQIGILPVVITPEMVGHTVGVFLAIEDKHSEWVFKGNETETGQLNFINFIKKKHGIACFATNRRDISNAILEFHKRFR